MKLNFKRASLICLLFLFLPLASLFSQRTITDLDGYDWKSWTDSAKYAYTLGFISGNFAATQNIVNMEVLTKEEINIIIEYLIITIDTELVMNEVNQFYEYTKNYDYPIVFVIFIRKLYKDKRFHIPWAEFDKPLGYGGHNQTFKEIY